MWKVRTRWSLVTGVVVATVVLIAGVVEEVRAQKGSADRASITKLELDRQSGGLSVMEMSGRATSVGNPRSHIGGAFTSYAGVQTLHFKSKTGQRFACPGQIYVGLAKNAIGPGQGFTGGIDWAFVVRKDLAVPNWVEDLTREMRVGHPQNVFLTECPNLSGVIRMDASGSEEKTKPGEEFGPEQRLLLVGNMVKRDGRWTFMLSEGR